jgi:hypothetical protein
MVVTNVQIADVIVASVIPAAARNATASASAQLGAYKYGLTKKLMRSYLLT